ncbi:MAG: class I SAM-dependent methyltransferase [Planctomycetes bacterium]|nr:class I SAM-dependent methyltransferase [Planctomycetota bacterium]
MSTTLAAVPSRSPWLHRLHGGDPYEGFDAAAYPLDLQGWNGTHPLLVEIVQKVRPEVVVEVGSWKGQSAVTFARELQRLGPGRTLLCVDTWLGGLEHWRERTRPDFFPSLRVRHGYPGLYWQFLANIVHSGVQDVVVPFPNTSLNAARWLLHEQVRADVVYIDASHEENDVFADLTYYWQVARPGGIVFGDDLGWPGVRAAVDRFVQQQGVQVGVRDNLWVLQKPSV